MRWLEKSLFRAFLRSLLFFSRTVLKEILEKDQTLFWKTTNTSRNKKPAWNTASFQTPKPAWIANHVCGGGSALLWLLILVPLVVGGLGGTSARSLDLSCSRWRGMQLGGRDGSWSFWLIWFAFLVF